MFLGAGQTHLTESLAHRKRRRDEFRRDMREFIEETEGRTPSESELDRLTKIWERRQGWTPLSGLGITYAGPTPIGNILPWIVLGGGLLWWMSRRRG